MRIRPIPAWNSFYINDIFGGSFVTDYVTFVIDQGSISFNAA